MRLELGEQEALKLAADFTTFTEASNVKDTAGMSKHRLERYIMPTITNGWRYSAA